MPLPAASEENKMTKIKVCGLTRMEDIQAVNEAMPDYCGFVINVEKSRRNCSPLLVKEMVCRLDKRILPVGVFVNAPLRLPTLLLREGTIAMAQLHGQEDEAYVRELQKASHCPVIKAFSVKTSRDVEKALKSPADYILLDQGAGGTGKTFDWSLVPEIERPFFLAGGLGTENLEEAVARLKPWAVDLSSSLETDGRKDPEKIKAAIDMVRKMGKDN